MPTASKTSNIMIAGGCLLRVRLDACLNNVQNMSFTLDRWVY